LLVLAAQQGIVAAGINLTRLLEQCATVIENRCPPRGKATLCTPLPQQASDQKKDTGGDAAAGEFSAQADLLSSLWVAATAW
jgi:hypothetical protein